LPILQQVFVVKFRVIVVVVYVAASSVNNDEYKLASRKSERLLDGKKFVLIHSEKKNGELIFFWKMDTEVETENSKNLNNTDCRHCDSWRVEGAGEK